MTTIRLIAWLFVPWLLFGAVVAILFMASNLGEMMRR